MTRTTGVIFSPVLGRTFFLPGFGASSLTEDEDDFNEELDVDVEFDVELELVEDDELDELSHAANDNPIINVTPITNPFFIFTSPDISSF